MASLSVVDNANGTVTFTVTGAIGTVNIYTGPWSGGLANIAWTLSATRSGNGTVNATLAAGYYFAYTDNGGAASTIIGVYVTDGTLVPADLILNAVQTKLRAMTFSGIAAINIVDPVKIPIRPPGQTIPAILISLVNENDRANMERDTNERENCEYAVQVQIIASTNRIVTDATERKRSNRWRQQIAKAFHRSRLPGNEAYRVEVYRGPPYDIRAWQEGMESHGVILRCMNIETRGVF